MNNIHSKFLKKAISIANKSFNSVYPNPYVGAIIVKNGKIIGKGYHKKCGGNHAEIEAIKNAKKDIKGSDLYVSLEPCSTYGKTPPCTNAIIESKIKRVFFGAIDNNPLNKNKAKQKLLKHGIHSKFIDFQNIHDDLNRVFKHNINSTIPYIQLKTAISLDGKITDYKGNSKWITDIKSRNYVQKIRSFSDAIMVGANTFNKDNPKLTIRLYKNKNIKDPAKIIITNKGILNFNHLLLKNNTESQVIILTTLKGNNNLKDRIKNKNCIIKTFNSKKNKIPLKGCLTYLKQLGYHNILVEGGSALISDFMKLKLFHELHVFIAPYIFGNLALSFSSNDYLDTLKQKSNLILKQTKIFNNDIYLRYNLCSQE